jgi:multicomponent Na+:H+ antiporter subunit B
MSQRLRTSLFVIAAAGWFGLLVWGMGGLSAFGHYPGPYGDIINAVGVAERHVQNVVTAVIFDYRGFDTLGEEFILFACVTGVTLLLRRESGENVEECAPNHELKEKNAGMVQPQASEAMRFFSLGFLALTIVLAIDVIITGHLSVGGGFQGGVILSSAWLLLYLSCGSEPFHRLSYKVVMEWFEAGGASAYAVIGAAALFFGEPFLTNILPLGDKGQLLSSGTILLINCAVGVEVTAGFVLLLAEFIKPLQTDGEKKQ